MLHLTGNPSKFMATPRAIGQVDSWLKMFGVPNAFAKVVVGLVGPVLAFVLEMARGNSARRALAGEAGVLAGGLALRYLVLLAAVPVLVGPAL